MYDADGDIRRIISLCGIAPSPPPTPVAQTRYSNFALDEITKSEIENEFVTANDE